MKAILYMNGKVIPVFVESKDISFIEGEKFTLRKVDSTATSLIMRSNFDSEMRAKYERPFTFISDIHPCADDPRDRFAPFLLGSFHVKDKPLLKKDSIKEVIFNGPATIIKWEDGTKTVVKCQPDDMDNFDYETGVALAIMKKVLGNKGNFNTVMKKLIDNAKYE